MEYGRNRNASNRPRTKRVGSGLLEGLGKEMMYDWEIEDGGEIEGISKKSRYQVVPADRLESFRKERLWGYLERNNMKNPVYYRLMKDGKFAGFKRIVTEWLPLGANRWQLDSIPHDDFDTEKLSKPAMGTAKLKREKISGDEQRRVTHPKSKEQTEPTPVPSRGGIVD